MGFEPVLRHLDFSKNPDFFYFLGGRLQKGRSHIAFHHFILPCPAPGSMSQSRCHVPPVLSDVPVPVLVPNIPIGPFRGPKGINRAGGGGKMVKYEKRKMHKSAREKRYEYSEGWDRYRRSCYVFLVFLLYFMSC